MDKRTHCLLYNPSVPVQSLKPLGNLTSIIADANNRTNSNQMAKMVRLNWMVQNIKDEPIRKPFLVNSELTIQTGDTRYAAIELNDFSITHVPCLMSTSVASMNLDWVYIQDKDHLGELLDISPDNILTHNDWHFNEIDWIEFSYNDTGHHMHDEDERYRMITNYLEQYPNTVFTREWLQTPLDWSVYR